MFISIIKSCINKPVEHFNLVPSLDWVPYVRGWRKEEWKFPNEIYCLLGHFGPSKLQIHIKRLSRRWHLKIGKGCYHLLCMDIVLQYTLQQGQTPPPSLSIQHEGSASHGRSESRQRKFQWKLSLIEFKSVTAVCRGQLYQKVEASFD